MVVEVNQAAASIAPTRRDVARELRRVYANAPFKQRMMAAGRPWIAPLELIVREIPVGSHHLDIGCGSGFLLTLSMTLRQTQAVVGVDVDERALALARQAALTTATHCSVRLLSAEAWPAIEVAAFDVVTMIDVLHHVRWEDRAAFLRQAVANVRSGGLFIYKDIAMVPRWAAAANYLHDLVLTGERVRLTPIAEVEAIAASGGGVLRKSLKVWRLWYAHEMRVFRKT
jgi:2-polyprenyl-3-methyl-5-hydroxy-6-metoxy-1,4-benzoquinol methylase